MNGALLASLPLQTGREAIEKKGLRYPERRTVLYPDAPSVSVAVSSECRPCHRGWLSGKLPCNAEVKSAVEPVKGAFTPIEDSIIGSLLMTAPWSSLT